VTGPGSADGCVGAVMVKLNVTEPLPPLEPEPPLPAKVPYTQAGDSPSAPEDTYDPPPPPPSPPVFVRPVSGDGEGDNN